MLLIKPVVLFHINHLSHVASLLLVLLDNDIVLLVTSDLIDLRLRGLLDEDLHSTANPADSDVAENVDEADSRDNVADTSARGISNGALDRREDSSSRDTHDKDTSSAASVSAKVGSTEGEDGGVHGSLKEEDGNQNTDGSGTGTSAAVGSESDGAARVDDHDELGAEEDSQASSDESTDCEGDESVAEHVAGRGSRDTTVLVGVVDEEGGDGNLGTDVAELSNEGEPHVVLLPDGTLVAVSSLILDDSFGDLGELGEEEENSNSGTSAGDSEVDKLDVGKAVLVRAREEELGGDQGADERSNTVPRLAELQTSVGGSRVTNNDCVRVGSGL